MHKIGVGQRIGTPGRKPSGRTTGRNKRNRVPVSVVFWILFFIVLIVAFFVLLPRVVKGNVLQKQTVTEQPEDTPAAGQKPPASEKAPQPEKPPAAKPPAEKPPVTPEKSQPQEKAPTEKPAGQTSVQPAGRQPVPPPAEKPVETRDRSIYLMRAERDDADLLLTKVNRKLKVSDSPLLDSLNALLAGPTAEEKNRGLVSFIPPNTRIISAQVRQNTAYLNFNEEFRYNTLGREGGAAQLKQIVWTATEFSTVHNVQILIEGKTVDFLIEGITIREPITR